MKRRPQLPSVDAEVVSGAWTMYVQLETQTVELGSFVGTLAAALDEARRTGAEHLTTLHASVGVVRAGDALPYTRAKEPGRARAKKEHAAFRAGMFSRS